MKKVSDYKEFFIKATQYAAVSCAQLRGCEDKEKADEAAVNAMRTVLMKSPINAQVAIGEGEIDEAPMLFQGEKLGSYIDSSSVPCLDIAVDPLECTKNCAFNLPNSMTVIAVAPKKCLLHAPDTYMNKLVSHKRLKNKLSLDFSIEKNISIIAKELNKDYSDIKVIVLDRPRNQYILDELTHLNTKIEKISDGDIVGSLRVATGESDLLLGIGSAPEGVITAIAIRGLDAHFEGKLHFHSKKAKDRARILSNHSVEKVLSIEQLCSSDNSLFIATGVCDGWIHGVDIDDDIAKTSSIIIDVQNREMIRVSKSHSINSINKFILEGI